MGVAARDGAASLGLTRTAAIFLIVMLLGVSAPAMASVYGYLYSGNTATVQAPTASVGGGTMGSSVVSPVAPDAATVTASAGLQFYESSAASAQPTGPVLDKSGNTKAGASSSITLNNLASGAPNELIYIEISMYSTSAVSVSGVTNTGTAALSWTHRGTLTYNSLRLETWWAVAAQSGTYSITATLTGGTADIVIVGESIENVATSEPFDPAVSSPVSTTGTTTASSQLVSVPISTQNVQDFIVGALASTDSHAPGVGAGFSTLGNQFQSTVEGAAEYDIVNTPQSGFAVGYSITTSGSDYALLGDALAATPVPASPSLDNGASTTTNNGNSLSINVQTTGPSELIYLVASVSGTTAVSASYPSSSPALTFTSRGSYSDSGSTLTIYTWYATASVAATYSVTVQLAASDNWILIGFSVSGVDLASPFDPGVSSQAQTSGTTTSNNQYVGTTFTTLNPDDFIFGGVVQNIKTNPGTGSGYSSIQIASTNAIASGTEYQDSASAGSFTPQFKLGSSGTVYVAIGEAFTPSPPANPDTSLTPPASSSSYSINSGQKYYLISPAFPVASTIYSGTWSLSLWVSSSAASSLTFAAYAMDSSGVVQATFLGSGSLASTTTKAQVTQTFTGAQGTVPSGGNVVVVLTAGSANFVVYWGAGQSSYLQTATTYNYVLSVSNGGTAALNVNLATKSAQTSNIGRLSSTLSFVSPASSQIIIASGSVTQASGTAATLSAAGTIDIQLVATANALPTSTNVPSTITFSIKVASTSSTAYSQYTVVVTLY